MTQRPIRLTRSKRAALGAAALLCYAAAIALTPSNVRSQLDLRTHAARLVAPAPAEPPLVPVAPDGDAFAPRADVGDDDPHPAVPTPKPPLVARVPTPVTALPPPTPAVRVIAIVTGTHPTAIIDTAGVERVVSVGDALDGSSIAAIDDGSVALTNGRRLMLEPGGGEQ